MRREKTFDGFPMRLFRWDPFFNFKEEPAIVPVWLKIHALPPQWFDLSCLKTIASSVGVFLKVDDLTYNRSRLNFARVCVEVNLKKKLPKKINLIVDNVKKELDIEFEKVPQYCHHCNHIGHNIGICYIKNPALKPLTFTNKILNKKNPSTTLANKVDLPAPSAAVEASGDGFIQVGKAGRAVGSGNIPLLTTPRSHKRQMMI